jgi:hypothetical protein
VTKTVLVDGLSRLTHRPLEITRGPSFRETRAKSDDLEAALATHEKTKLKLRIDFDGRKHPFHPDSEETAGTLKAEAISFFSFVGDPNTLGLFRANNSMLDDGTPLANYHLADDELLVMRQRNVGGGAA